MPKVFDEPAFKIADLMDSVTERLNPGFLSLPNEFVEVLKDNITSYVNIAVLEGGLVDAKNTRDRAAARIIEIDVQLAALKREVKHTLWSVRKDAKQEYQTATNRQDA